MIKETTVSLKELRMLYNYSQKEAADKLDISHLYNCSTDYLPGKTNDTPSMVLDTNGLNQEQIQVLQSLIKVMKHG